MSNLKAFYSSLCKLYIAVDGQRHNTLLKRGNGKGSKNPLFFWSILERKKKKIFSKVTTILVCSQKLTKYFPSKFFPIAETISSAEFSKSLWQKDLLKKDIKSSGNSNFHLKSNFCKLDQETKGCFWNFIHLLSPFPSHIFSRTLEKKGLPIAKKWLWKSIDNSTTVWKIEKFSVLKFVVLWNNSSTVVIKKMKNWFHENSKMVEKFPHCGSRRYCGGLCDDIKKAIIFLSNGFEF